MNNTINTACYEFIYMYRNPWRTGALIQKTPSPDSLNPGRRPELGPAPEPPTPATRQEHTQRRLAENPF